MSDLQASVSNIQGEQVILQQELRKSVRYVLQSTWTEIGEEGEIIPGTEDDSVGFDGDAYDNGVVRVCIGRSQDYPFTYDINPELDGLYLRHVVELKSEEELLLYMTAHELRHLWQWENPEKVRQIRRLLKCDDETDADIFATMTLTPNDFLN